MEAFPAVIVKGLLMSLRSGFPKALQGETQLIRVTRNPGVPGVGRSLRAHPVTHLPLAQVAQKNGVPNKVLAADLVGLMVLISSALGWTVLSSPALGAEEQFPRLPAALCGGWGRLAQLLAVPTFQGAAVTSRKVQVQPLLLAPHLHVPPCTPSMRGLTPNPDDAPVHLCVCVAPVGDTSEPPTPR